MDFFSSNNKFSNENGSLKKSSENNIFIHFPEQYLIALLILPWINPPINSASIIFIFESEFKKYSFNLRKTFCVLMIISKSLKVCFSTEFTHLNN